MSIGNAHQLFLEIRDIFIRRVGCPTCGSHAETPCIGMAGIFVGMTLQVHHFGRHTATFPEQSAPFPVQVPIDAPLHWGEDYIALSTRVRSVNCPECGADPGQPCRGVAAYKGQVMSRHHGSRASLVDPGMYTVTECDRLEAV